ncbi:hypothetical protein EV291_12781 [Rhizobium sp. BK068]|nr:hypothetical protein EV291_12781 [Rhizobium sp. BK068]
MKVVSTGHKGDGAFIRYIVSDLFPSRHHQMRWTGRVPIIGCAQFRTLA